MNLSLILNIAITGLIILIFGLCFLRGIIAGFKSSTTLGLINLVLVIVVFACTKSLTTQLINYDFSSLNITLNGTQLTTLQDFILSMLESQPAIQDLITDSTGVSNLIIQIPYLVIAPFLFTALFWASKLIIWIVSLVIGLFELIIRAFTKKKPTPQIGPNGLPIKQQKPSKKRLIGGLVGLASGIIITIATFTPMFGLGSIINQLNCIKETSDGSYVIVDTNSVYADEEITYTGKSLLDNLTNQDITSMINDYNSNVGLNIAKYTGLEFISTQAYNSLASFEMNGVKVKLVDEINNVINIYIDYDQIMKYLSKAELTQSEMDELLVRIDKTVEHVFDDGIINILGDELLPKIIDKMLTENNAISLPETITNDQLKNLIVTEILKELKNHPFSGVENFVNQTINTLQILNDEEILTPLYNSYVGTKEENKLSTVQLFNLLKNSSSEFSSNLSTQLIDNLPVINNILPDLLDEGLCKIFDRIGKTYISKKDPTTTKLTDELKTEAKEDLKNLVADAIDLIKSLNVTEKIDDATQKTTISYDISKNSIKTVGSILDKIKNCSLLTPLEYQNLTIYAEDKLNEKLNSVSSTIDFDVITDNISDVQDWSLEFNKLYNIYDNARNIVDKVRNYDNLAFDSISKINTFIKYLDNLTANDNENVSLKSIGIIIDELQTTTIFNKTDFKQFIQSIEVELNNKLSLPNIDISSCINNLSEIEIWENELEKISNSFKEIDKIANKINAYGSLSLNTTENINNFIKYFNNETTNDYMDISFVNLANLLDYLETTTIFGGNTITIYNSLLDSVAQDVTNFDNTINSIKITAESVTWSNEIPALITMLKNVLPATSIEFNSISDVNNIMTIVEAFDTLENDANSVYFSANSKNILNAALTDITDMNLSETANLAIVEMKTMLTNRQSNELLKDCVIKGILSYAKTHELKSENFTDPNINSMITKINDNITKALNKDVGFESINYSNELNYLIEFVNLTDKLQNISSLDDTTIADLSNALDDLNSSLILGGTKVYIVDYIIETAKSAINDSKYNTAFTNLQNKLKNNINSLSISQLLTDLDTVEDKANTLKSLEINKDISSDLIANPLNAIKNCSTIGYEFANDLFVIVLNELNTEIQNDSYIPSANKTNVNNYVSTLTLNSESNYKNIIDDIKALATNI